MVETITRLYHCHKIHKHVTVYEEYEVSDSGRHLLRSRAVMGIMTMVFNVVMQKINNQAH